MPTHSNIKKSYNHLHMMLLSMMWCIANVPTSELKLGAMSHKDKNTCRKSSWHTRCWRCKTKWILFKHILSF